MATVIIGTIVFGAFGFAFYKVYRDKKSGSNCSGGCSNCESSCNRKVF